MKRLISILLTLAMIFTAGCSGSEDKFNTEGFDAGKFYDSVSSMTSDQLAVLDDTYISNYYGIDIADLDSYVFAQSEDPNSAETIILFKCGDEAKRGEYIKAVQNAVSQKADELKNYNQPEQAKLVEDCKMGQANDLVYVIISSSADDIYEALEKELLARR